MFRSREFVRTMIIAGAAVGLVSPQLSAQEMPGQRYYVYVGAESADLMHRIVLGPEGASVEATVPVGEMSLENEGPHGFITSPDGEYIYMTTGHGVPNGKLWKFDAGADTLVAAPILLGKFPATMDLTPDGLYAFIVNFNLHGDHVPSTVSVAFTPDMIEVDQIETCTMPHGLRMHPDGTRLYTNCMMDDQMVEIDTSTFEVSRRFSVMDGMERGIPTEWAPDPEMHGHRGMPMNTCSPTWVEPHVDGSRAYVACNKSDRLLEIDLESWELLRSVETGRGIYNLDITPDGRMIVGTLKQGAGVEFFDIETMTSLGRVESSTTVTHGVVISPDSRYAFVSVEGVGAEPGKVDIYDLATREQIAEVEVGQQAGGITFWKVEPAEGL